MGIDFDDQNVDVSGVSDQRGRSGGMGGPIAIGGGGLEKALIFRMLWRGRR